MKKLFMRYLFTFLAVFFLLSCQATVIKTMNSEETNPAINNTENLNANASIRGICIFDTQVGSFNSSSWDSLAASPVTDYIFIPKDIGAYGGNKEGYINNLAPIVLNFIQQITTRKPNASIWIGTPGINSTNYNSATSSLDPFYDFILSLKTALGNTVWETNIAGIYMNMEAIYGTVDENNLITNSCIKLMNDLSYRIHVNLEKEFLWIPYYGYGNIAATLIKNIGLVANKNTIFDYVVLQPHYYFDDTVPTNIDGVQTSVTKQAITYRDGVIVTPKTSQTIIGAEMEMSWKIIPPNNYPDFLARYTSYVNAFAQFKDVYPIIYYWDGEIKAALTSRINPFFN